MDELSFYFYHPLHRRSYRLSLKKDLLGDWVLTRIYNHRIKRGVYNSYRIAFSELEKTMKSCIKRGYIELVKKESMHSRKALETQADGNTGTQGILKKAAKAFTENNDWIDLANCFELSADEFTDTNWKRFKSWLSDYYEIRCQDQDIYQFAYLVWKGYRNNVAIE